MGTGSVTGWFSREFSVCRRCLSPFSDADTATPAQLRSFADQCHAMLDTARAALDQPCQVPVEYNDSYILDVMPNIQESRALGRAFLAEGALAEINGDWPKAVGYYLDTVRLGKAFSREGLAIHSLVGYAIEGIGQHSLHEMRDSLTRRQCQELSTTLRTLEAQSESPDVAVMRDRVWTANAGRWTERLLCRIQSALGAVDSFYFAMEGAFNRKQARYRILRVELALAGYRLEYGAYPERLAELAPEHIDVLPEDPFSGKPLVYRLTPKGYLLYSIGPNGVDDDGKTFGASTNADDVLFE